MGYIFSLVLFFAFVAGFYHVTKKWRYSLSKRQGEQKAASSRDLYEQQKNKNIIYNHGRKPEIWQNVSVAIDSPHEDDVQRAMDEIDADTQNDSIRLADGILIGQKWFKHKSYVVPLESIRVLCMDNVSTDRDGIKEIDIIMFTANPYLSGHIIKTGYDYGNAQKIAETVCSRAPHVQFTDITREPKERQRQIFMELNETYPRYRSR